MDSFAAQLAAYIASRSFYEGALLGIHCEVPYLGKRTTAPRVVT